MKPYILKSTTPAVVWQDALPTGNGSMSALVYGNAQTDKILLNYEKWWYRESTPGVPDCSKFLSDVRKLMDNKNYAAAERIYPSEMRKYRPLAAAALYQPGIDLRVSREMNGEYSDYSRTLDMSSAEVKVAFNDGQGVIRRQFASRDNGMFVLNIPGRFDGKIWLEPHDLGNGVGIFGEPFRHGLEFSSTMSGQLMHLQGKRARLKSDREDFFATLGSDSREKRFGALLRVAFDFGCLETETYSVNEADNMAYDTDDTMKTGIILKIVGGVNVTLAVVLYEGEEECSISEKRIIETELDYDKLFAAHKGLHSGLFMRSRIEFGEESERSCERIMLDAAEKTADTELLSKLYCFGRYLLIISTGECCLPAHLTGKWNGDYFAPWRSVYFMNENTQLIYHQAFSGALFDLLLPLFDFLEQKLPDFRENARKLYGCRGIRIPNCIDAYSGAEKNYLPHALYWNGGAAWIASMFYTYYEYTLDEKFLAERAYPFMKEAAEFYEDFLVLKNGKLCSYPSASPENCPLGSYVGAGKINVSIDSTMDIALIKDLLGNLIKTAGKFRCDSEKSELWKKMLSMLPEYRRNEDGALAEWIYPEFNDNYNHRHLSHLFPLFPGTEIGSDSEELFKACSRALEMRMTRGLKDMSGWALVHTANVYAHLKDADGVKNCLLMLARHFTGKNLFCYHNNDSRMGVGMYLRWSGHTPHQLDANSGFTSAVQQAAAYARGNTIYILPAFSEEFGDMRAYGLMLRGGIEIVSLQKADKILSAKIKVAKSGEYIFELPFAPKKLIIGGNVTENAASKFVLNLPVCDTTEITAVAE